MNKRLKVVNTKCVLGKRKRKYEAFGLKNFVAILRRCDVSVCLLKSESFLTFVSDSSQTRERNVEINLKNFHYRRFCRCCNSSWTVAPGNKFSVAHKVISFKLFCGVKRFLFIRRLKIFALVHFFTASIIFRQFLTLLGSKTAICMMSWKLSILL